MRMSIGSAGTALVFMLCAGSAPALTPEEAWAAFQTSVTAGGQTLDVGGTSRVGDTLTVSDVVMAIAIPDGGGFTTTLPALGFKDIGDGAVEVIYPSAFDAALTLPDGAPDAPKSIALALIYDGLSMTAKGDAARPEYAFSARSAAATIKEIKDQTGKVMDVTGVFSMTDISGEYTLPQVAGDLISGDSMLAAGTIAMSFEGTDPDGFVLSGSLAIKDMQVTGQTAMLDPTQMQASMTAMLAAGMKVDTKLSTGAIAISFKAERAAEAGSFDATFAGTSVAVFLDRTRIDYGFSVLGANMAARGNTLPVPEIATAFAETSLAFSFPVAVSDQPQPFGLLVKLVDLTLTEDVWAMVDPGAQLPRDPVSFIVDLKGTGAWTVDIMDPAAQVGQGPDLPARLFTLDLTQLLAKAAGAQVAGAGALTFDNANLAPLGGFPAPTGKVTVTLTGINALMDALVAIGLVPEEELMGVRMGLAMLARPGAGPDELISEVEFQDGQMTINGQPM
jgi:hypothetical protein